MKRPLTVVGIPARNEEQTIGKVAETADRGLREAFPHGENVLVLAENGSTDDTVDAFQSASVETRRVVLGTEAREWGTGAETGKGANMLGIIAKSLDWGADQVVFLDADVRSVESWWVGALAGAVSHDDTPAMAVPVYRRSRWEANTTAHLAAPLLAATLGRYIQQPIGGEFAVNRACMERVIQWPRPESALQYGVDIWLTGNGLRENMQVIDVPLGRKIHSPPFRKALHMPQQVLDAAFHVIASTEPRPLQTPATDRSSVDDDSGSPPAPELIAQVTQAVARYLDTYRSEVHELFPTTRELEKADWGTHITTEHWPRILADALTALSAGRHETARDHLIALYVQRIRTWWTEIEHLDATQTQDLVTQQVHQTASVVQQRRLSWSGLHLPYTFDVGNWKGYNSLTFDSTAGGSV